MKRRRFIQTTVTGVVTNLFIKTMAEGRQRTHPVLSIPGLISHWDFSLQDPLRAKGPHPYILTPSSPRIAFSDDGPLSGRSVTLREGEFLTIPRRECPALNVYGKDASVTVLTWVKRRPKSHNQCEAVAGMWNETKKQRQYCLFLNLGIHDSAQQVGGHISGVGGPTPGHKYCMDAAIGETVVPYDAWSFVAMTYDGRQIKAYYNGVLDARPNRNPYDYPEGIFDGGEYGADFTVGAVDRSAEMGNFYVGKIGGLSVFDRALGDAEIAALFKAYPTGKL